MAEHRPCLLVVEDTKVTQVLIRAQLEPRYRVDMAGDAQEALACAGARQYDAVIMDIELGEALTGVEVLHALRGMAGYAKVPVIACTAHALARDRHRYLDAGFDAYLAKPFRREELYKLLEAMLGTPNTGDSGAE